MQKHTQNTKLPRYEDMFLFTTVAHNPSTIYTVSCIVTQAVKPSKRD